ncbi:MAG: hypothetical protein ABIQ39_05900 [Ilumatobacteraceae bacterium]
MTAATEFTWHCAVCPKNESWTTEQAAQAASVWHVYNDHREVWTTLMGTPDRLPVDRMPEDYGRKFEEWERQG